MATTPEIQFALKAINEASKVLKDIQGDIDNLADAADDGAPKLSDLGDQLSDVAKAAGDGAQNVGSFGTKLDGVGEAGGNAETALRGVGDITGFAAEQFGISLGPMDQYIGGLGQLGGGIEAAIKGFPGLITQLGAATTAAWAHVSALIAQAAAFIAANAPMLIMIGSALALGAAIFLIVRHWDEVKAGFFAVKDALMEAAGAVLGFFQDHWPIIATLIAGPFAPIVALATDAFGVRSALTGAFDSALTYIRELGGKAWDAAKNVGDNLMDGLKSALSSVAGFAGGVAEAVLSAVKGVVNTYVIDPINRTLEFSFNTHIPGIGTIHIDPPDIPRLAAGGIVMSSTMALVGEAGPEAVVPLTAFDDAVGAINRVADTLEILAGKLYSGVATGGDVAAFLAASAMNGSGVSPEMEQFLRYGLGASTTIGWTPGSQQGWIASDIGGARVPGAGFRGVGSINYYGPGDPHAFKRFLDRAGVFA